MDFQPIFTQARLRAPLYYLSQLIPDCCAHQGRLQCPLDPNLGAQMWGRRSTRNQCSVNFQVQAHTVSMV